MTSMIYNQDIIDRANEWVSEHYPELDGQEYDAKLSEACAEISAIDSDADASQ